MKDLEPVQERSIADFSDFTIEIRKTKRDQSCIFYLRLFLAGRYRIRVVSLHSPHIFTPWHEIFVGE